MDLPYPNSDLLAAAAPVALKRIEIWACRAPLETPVETSFGAMNSRPAVFVRLEDHDGAFGFGEVWCNFPGCGAEHRARLIAEELAPLALKCAITHPSDLFRQLSAQVHIRVLQSGEPGPYSQAIAGLDIALWDLFAKRAGAPLRYLLNPHAADSIPAYASGIDIRQAKDRLPNARSEGYRAFKVKVGFDLAEDVWRVKQIAERLHDGERLFADANQAWTPAEAVQFAEGVKDVGLGWIEEPLAADAPHGEWKTLAEATSIPLAAGENIAGAQAFQEIIEGGALSIIQPDVAKWGGPSGCFDVARRASKAGRIYCPHFLGGGIGLLASAHLLAAAGGPGLLEVDCNDNPMRQQIWSPSPQDGRIALDMSAGLGVEQLPPSLLHFVSYSCKIQ